MHKHIVTGKLTRK